MSASRPNLSGEPEGIEVMTMVLWSVCLGVGLLGFFWHYEKPPPPAPAEVPVLAEELQVELTEKNEPIAPTDPPATPPPPEQLIQPILDKPVAVTHSTPAIAFAVPVERPDQVVETKKADYATVQRQTNPVVQRLIFGQDEGKQPAPEYPRNAKRLGQEGTVTVRFTVGADGRVLSAEAAQPCPWPLLNEAALEAVRQHWRFPSGAIRLYDVSIRFELLK